MTIPPPALAGLALLVAPSTVQAHPAQQALILLMPTDLYIGIGTGIVALTAVLLGGVPDALERRLFPTSAGRTTAAGASHPQRRTRPTEHATEHATASLLVTAVLAALLALGVHGPHDPLANLLPLGVWTLWWIGIVLLVGLLGTPRNRANPWSGVMRHVLRQPAGSPGALCLPDAWGAWPGVTTLLLINAFVLADPAPDQPARLAALMLAWWATSLLMLLAFGERRWLARGECLSMLIERFAALSPWQLDENGRRRLGLPGRRLVDAASRPGVAMPGAAVFCLLMLGSGSFDGLADTFAWLALIGVNPLEHPGRSALIASTLLGLVLFNVMLVGLFALAANVGTRLAGPARCGLPGAFDSLAPCVLPIAFAYHLAHYLPALLVNGQYALVALGDPFGEGRDPFGLGPWFVSTGFFNEPTSVAVIWFVQAAAVVLGHLLSMVMTHRIARNRYPGRRRAALAQLPMVAFMLGYTLFGLWLLAAPRGA